MAFEIFATGAHHHVVVVLVIQVMPRSHQRRTWLTSPPIKVEGLRRENLSVHLSTLKTTGPYVIGEEHPSRPPVTSERTSASTSFVGAVER